MKVGAKYQMRTILLYYYYLEGREGEGGEGGSV